MMRECRYARSGAAAAATLGLLCWVASAAPPSEPPPAEVPPADADETVTLIPAFKTGDRIDLELVMTRETRKPGQAPQIAASVRPVAIEVLERNADGTILRFELGRVELPDVDAEIGSSEALDVFTAPQRYEVSLNADWDFEGLRNWKEVQQQFRDILEKLFSMPGKGNTPTENEDRARELLEELIGTREAVELLAIRDISVYWYPLGRELPRRGTLEQNETLPNPFGGDPFPARRVLRLAEYEPNRRARVVMEQTIDPEKGTAALADTLKRMAERTGQPLPEDLPRVDVRDRAEFVMDLASGWVTEARFERRTVVDDHERVQVTHWRRPTATDAPTTRAATPAETP